MSQDIPFAWKRHWNLLDWAQKLGEKGSQGITRVWWPVLAKCGAGFSCSSRGTSTAKITILIFKWHLTLLNHLILHLCPSYQSPGVLFFFCVFLVVGLLFSLTSLIFNDDCSVVLVLVFHLHFCGIQYFFICTFAIRISFFGILIFIFLHVFFPDYKLPPNFKGLEWE